MSKWTRHGATSTMCGAPASPPRYTWHRAPVAGDPDVVALAVATFHSWQNVVLAAARGSLPGLMRTADRIVRSAPHLVRTDEPVRARLEGVGGVPVMITNDTSLGEGPGADEIACQHHIPASALANAANALNPSVLVQGGLLAALAQVDVAALADDLRVQAMPACAEDLDVRVAALAGDRLLIGAAEAPFDTLLSAPAAVAGPSTTGAS